jgi:hypothetical protein
MAIILSSAKIDDRVKIKKPLSLVSPFPSSPPAGGGENLLFASSSKLMISKSLLKRHPGESLGPGLFIDSPQQFR